MGGEKVIVMDGSYGVVYKSPEEAQQDIERLQSEGKEATVITSSDGTGKFVDQTIRNISTDRGY